VDYWQRGLQLAQQLQVDTPSDTTWSDLITDFQQALSGCGIFVAPEATQETGG
jgi:hypothetical protein